MNPPCISAQSHADDEAERKATALEDLYEEIITEFAVIVACQYVRGHKRWTWAVTYRDDECCQQVPDSSDCMDANDADALGWYAAEERARELAKANLKGNA